MARRRAIPGRVGLGVASGSLPQDFDAMHVPMDDMARRFTAAFEELVGILDGRAPGVLLGDPAVAGCASIPMPAARARRWGSPRPGAPPGSAPAWCSTRCPRPSAAASCIDEFRSAGGTAPSVLIRRAWLGEAPRGDLEAQLQVYRGYAVEQAQRHWGKDELVGTTDAAAVAEGLADALARSGAEALNLRVHVPGVTPGPGARAGRPAGRRGARPVCGPASLPPPASNAVLSSVNLLRALTPLRGDRR